MLVDTSKIFDAIDRTWAPRTICEAHGWHIREGDGGGKRVSAATRLSPAAQIDAAEDAMRHIGQTPLFMVRKGEGDLDQDLATRGYRLIDPVTIYRTSAALDNLAGHRVIFSDVLLVAMADIWAAGGIGPSRLKVMERVAPPKSYILVRDGDRPAGVGFVAADGPVAMIHAIEVKDRFRRKGMGKLLVDAAAHWANAEGAECLTLAVTDANTAANALYRKIGMEPAGQYHYRLKDG